MIYQGLQVNKKFSYPIPNFTDRRKSIIFWRYLRFQARKILYFPQVRLLEKTLNEEKNKHLKDFFSQRPYACYNAIRRFCDKSFKANERVKHLFMMLIRDLLVLNFFPKNK